MIKFVFAEPLPNTFPNFSDMDRSGEFFNNQLK